MAAAASTGRMVTGVHTHPFGYDGDPETWKRVINEVEAEVVLRVFGLYAGGSDLAEIVDLLNAEGVRTKTDKTWSLVGLRQMLTKTSYMGLDYYGRTMRAVGGGGRDKRVAAPKA